MLRNRCRIRGAWLATSILVAVMLQGCAAWRSRSITPQMFSGAERLSIVRVTLADGHRVTLTRPFIQGDSLIGESEVLGGSLLRGEREAYALSTVRSVEAKQVAAGRTLLLIAGIGITVVVLAVASTSSWGSGRGGGDDTAYTGSFSCPLVYSWNGTGWQLDSGTFGGAIMSTLQRTDVDNLDYVRASRGVLKLKLANELNETDYVDALDVLAVDHDPNVTVIADAAGVIHTLGTLTPPASARDFRLHDAMDRVRDSDGWCWESIPTGRDPQVAADVRDGLELSFPRPAGAATARLLLDGNNTPWAARLLGWFVEAHGTATKSWYDSLQANPEGARAMAAKLAGEAFLGVSVWESDHWQRQGTVWEAGPEIRKRQMVSLDLARVQGDEVRVRLESVPSFWLLDRVALDFSAEQTATVTALEAERATDEAGRDLRPILRATDGRTFAMETGELAHLQFKAPDLSPGQARSYLVRSHGWYHIHTNETGEPQRALLAQLATTPMAISRTAVAKMNEALRSLEGASR